MKKTTKKVSNLIKGLASIIMLVITGFLITANVSAWGPERDTFTMQNPASYPTFNSITDNPTIGDERDFVRVGQINADVTELGNEVEVVPGKQYLVYIYFHNNASATYNDSAHDHVGVAVKTKMNSFFNNVLTPNEKATISATVMAENSKPTSVWDEAYMTTTYPKVLLHYVAGSAKIRNDWGTNGKVLPSSLFTESGTYLGLNELNGVVPGCEQYHGVVTYVLQADELRGTIEKEVTKDGTNYSNSIKALPGDELQFRLTVKNAGDIALGNATISDALPEGLTLVPGSVQFMANDSGIWEPLSDNIIGSGYNFGTIGTGNVAYITYRVKVSNDIDCNGLTLTNTATLVYDSETSSGDNDNSSTSVIVERDDCIPEDCTTNPNLPGCTPETPPETPETPKEIVKTGPLEITMAVIVILGIGAGGFYLYRTRRTLKTVESAVTGPEGGANPSTGSSTPIDSIAPTESSSPETPETPTEEPTAPEAPASFSAPAEPTPTEPSPDNQIPENQTPETPEQE